MESPTLIAAVFFGAASFISPCVLPMLPGYLALMSGHSIAELSSGEASTRRVVIGAIGFISGFTAVFVALGAFATALSEWLLSEASLFRTAAGWVVILMGLFIAVTAVWNPRFLLPFMKDRKIQVTPSKLGRFAPPVMGGAFAFGWTPCVGPFLAATFALAGSSDTVGRGMIVLLFYSLGLGIPFLASAVLLSRAFSAFDWLKRRLVPINIASGLLLAFFGVLLLTNQITQLSSFFTDLLVRLGLDGLAEV